MTTIASDTRPGLFIGGEWRTGSGQTREVRNPYDGSLLAVVPEATDAEVDEAIAAAVEAMRERPLTPFQRFEILSRASRLVDERAEDFAQVIVAEAGKPLREARGEVTRAVQTLLLCAEEAKRLPGEVVPFDATPGSEHRIGFTLPMPAGVVCAITPFNAPLNQMNHKAPTALAAGCAVVLKPAELTPLCAIRLVEVFEEAGLPPGHLNLVLGAGETVGQRLLEDERFAAYSFTGSVAVGRHIRESVGLRKTVLELGNNSPNIVHRDADLTQAAGAVAKSAFAYAGQLCISAQRVLVHDDVHDEFLRLFAAEAERLRPGDPSDEQTDIGPMITEAAAARAERTIADTVSEGARLVTGGSRHGRIVEPTVLADVTTDMTIARDEAFAPVAAVMRYASLDDAVAIANGTRYGLQAAVFTTSLDVALHLARRIEFGGIMVNEGSHFRIDQMPFGGVKESGTGREGVRYAIHEFIEPRLVAIATRDPR
ncbi:MAG TPA: aldehyde dehydrogenase family protein [Solirubrobacter sp.]|jgi:acyl-CoA reductase-like NAD-dependent aldehyde dehydrogenase|nr:aldehyde dehydrogenase family protein [Solirubrobacter sp.]